MLRRSKLVLFVSFLITGLIFMTACQSSINKAEETIDKLEADNEINDEVYMDAKQIFETLEQAHYEERELTVEEKQLVNEFDAKYNRDSVELTHVEKMIVLQLLLMSKETTDYESERENLLEYVEFE